MSLGEKRRQFSLDLAILIVWANREGYGIAIDDVKARDGHIKNSKHYDGLAADLNLYFFIDGRWAYQTSTEAHTSIGEEWERMGNSWGGRFSKPDGNHYSCGKDESRR